MLDIKFIRENVDVAELLKLADERKDARQKVDELNAKRNLVAREQNVELGKKLKQEAEQIEAHFTEVDKKYLSLMLKVPNLVSPDTPIGPDEGANKVLRQVGEKPVFDFTPLEHQVLGEKLGLLDTEKAGQIAGARFAYLKGDLVRLQFALIQFCLNILTNQATLAKIAEEAKVQVKVTP